MAGLNGSLALKLASLLAKMQKSKLQFNKLSSYRAGDSGFTLIELLMAMSIFALTSMAVIAIFLSMTAGHRRSLNVITLNNTAYIAMETIAKEIRTGKDFSCIVGSVSSCDEIGFTNYRGQNVSYKLTVNQIEKTCSGSGCAAGKITPSNINISYLKFNLKGTDVDGIPDNKQSKINIVLTAQTPAGTPVKYQRTLNLQTTISSRNIDS